MSVGPLGTIGAAAGSPLAQRTGSDVQRAAQDTAVQARATDSAQKTAKAEGIGEMEQDHETTDRDADGRRVWERTQEEANDSDDSADATTEEPRSLDASGDRGNQLDLSG